MSAALYIYGEHKSEAAAQKEAAALAHRGAVVRPLKARGTWNVLVSDSKADEAQILSFDAIRQAYDVQEAVALDEAEQKAGEHGREHIVREGHALYSSFRYRGQRYDEYSQTKPLKWIVRNVLPRAELAVIYGEPGSGKSNLGLDMLGAVGAGIEWCGHRTTKGRSFIFAGEAGAGLKQRAKAYKLRHPEVSADDMPLIESAPLNLRDGKDVAELIRTLKAQGPFSTLLIDTLAAVTPGAEENASKDMGEALINCRAIHRETGATVILIAHCGKDHSRGVRGWSGTRGAVDCEIEVTRDGEARQWTVRKMRDGPDDGICGHFKLDVVDMGLDDDFEPVTSCVLEHLAAPVQTAEKKRPSGPRQVLLLEMLKTLAPSGTVALETLVEAYKDRIPRSESKQDDRRKCAKQALEGLISKGLAHMHDDDEVSLTPLVSSNAEPF